MTVRVNAVIDRLAATGHPVRLLPATDTAIAED
jgi:hypothetical protein